MPGNRNTFMAMWDDGLGRLFLLLVAMGLLALFATLLGQPPETGNNVIYVRHAAELCPDISGRVDELMADGRITDDEMSIVPTLRDQVRASPGGLTRCHID